jgi:hypothetical protein
MYTNPSLISYSYFTFSRTFYKENNMWLAPARPIHVKILMELTSYFSVSLLKETPDADPLARLSCILQNRYFDLGRVKNDK